MEIYKQVDKDNYVDYAYLRGIRPYNEYIFLIDVKHGGEYELSVSIKDVKNNKPNFKIMPSKSAVAKQCAKDFATKHWEFIKECVLIMEQCNFYDTGKAVVEKARKWDAHVAGNEMSNSGTNIHIKIFEVEAEHGKLIWVAAESVWKATLHYIEQYQPICISDEIKEVTELPKQKWSEYFLHEDDGRLVAFDKLIQRRRVFPQVLAETDEDGFSDTNATVINTPLIQTPNNISSSKNRSHATA